MLEGVPYGGDREEELAACFGDGQNLGAAVFAFGDFKPAFFLHAIDGAADGGFFHAQGLAELAGANFFFADDDGKDIELVDGEAVGPEGFVVEAGDGAVYLAQATGDALLGHLLGDRLGGGFGVGVCFGCKGGWVTFSDINHGKSLLKVKGVAAVRLCG